MGLVASAALAVITGLLWPDPPPPPSSKHMILVDVSEGVDPALEKAFSEFIKDIVRQANEGDLIEVARITERSDGPLQKMHEIRVKANWEQLQNRCKKDKGELPVCGTPMDQFTHRFGRHDKICGIPAIQDACTQDEKLEKTIKEIIIPLRGPLRYSPLVEAMESADLSLEEWTNEQAEKLNAGDDPPAKGTLFIYSDMLQHTRWYSMLNPKFKHYVPFHKWDDWNLFLEKRRNARGLDSPRKIESNVKAYFIKRRAIRSKRHERKLRRFWDNLIEGEMEWIEVKRNRQLLRGGPV